MRSVIARTDVCVVPLLPVTGMSLPSKSVVYDHDVVSPRALTDVTVTFMPFAPNGSYVMTLLCGAGESDLSFQCPNRGLVFWASALPIEPIVASAIPTA